MKSEPAVYPRIEKLADLPFYTEGPAVDRYGSIFFSTLTGGRILKMESRADATEWAGTACPNGQIILPNGDHLVCDSLLSALLRFGPDGSFIKYEIREHCAREKVFTPNDLVTDSKGNIYFTDSVRYSGKVFFVGFRGRQEVLARNLDYPNGLVLSRDEKWLYVAESFGNRILKIDLEKRDRNENPETLADLPRNISGKKENNLPDGLAMDKTGNIWVAHHGMGAVHSLSPDGRLLRSLETGLLLTSNLIFLDDRTLIVTGGDGEPGPGALLKIQL